MFFSEKDPHLNAFEVYSAYNTVQLAMSAVDMPNVATYKLELAANT